MNNRNDPEDIDLNPPLFPNGWSKMDIHEQRKSQFFGEYDTTVLVDLVTVQDYLIQRNKTLAAKVSFQAVCDKMENEMQNLRNISENNNGEENIYYESEDSYMKDEICNAIATPNHHYEYTHVNTWVLSLRFN